MHVLCGIFVYDIHRTYHFIQVFIKSEDVYDFIMFVGFFAVSSLTYHDGSCHEVDPGALH